MRRSAMAVSVLLVTAVAAAPARAATTPSIKIASVHAKGKYAAEYVTLRNATGTAQTIPAASPSEYQLTLSKGPAKIIQFDDARLTIKAHGTAIVRFRCAAGAKKPKQSGRTLNLCLDRGHGGYGSVDVLPDGGATIKLVDNSSGATLSRLAYGSAAARTAAARRPW
jgi:hypothetical protein